MACLEGKQVYECNHCVHMDFPCQYTVDSQGREPTRCPMEGDAKWVRKTAVESGAGEHISQQPQVSTVPSSDCHDDMYADRARNAMGTYDFM